MGFRWLGLGLLSGAVIASPLGAADERLQFTPSGPWIANYDADSCALRRSFVSGEHEAHLEFRRFAPGWGLQTTVATSHAGARSFPNVRYRFTDDGAWRNPGLGLSVTLDGGLRGVIIEPAFAEPPEGSTIGGEDESDGWSFDFKAAEREQAAAIDSLSFHGLGREFVLQLGKLEAPIGALQDCVDELMTHWNIDAEAHKTLTRRAWPVNWSAGSRMLDYPPKMQRQRMPGLVNVRLAIDETGRITGCSIQMPLSDPAFQESSCADIQHAFDFDPALDKDGKPIASYWTTRVIFTF